MSTDSNKHEPRRPHFAVTTIPLLICLGLSPSAFGQWSGAIELAVVGDSVDDSLDSFRSQYNLDDGLGIEDLVLQYIAEDGSAFSITASGFGSIEPSQHAGLAYRPKAPWEFSLDYDRRESFFSLDEFEQPSRVDDWDIQRWHANAAYDGWSTAKLNLDLRYQQRDGQITRPYLALNEHYPLLVDLDETLTEASFSLESRNWPVTVYFEQSFTQIEDQNQWRPADPEAYLGDPDLFTAANRDRQEENDIPTSLLVLTYPGSRFQFAGSLLYSPAELDVAGSVSSRFDIIGGAAGQLETLEDSIASAERDLLTATGRFSILITDQLTLNVNTEYRDASTDTGLIGERLLRASNPAGSVFDISAPLNARSVFEVTDEKLRADLEWTLGKTRLWLGLFTTSKEVMSRSEDAAATNVDRGGDGFALGAAWRWRGWRGSAEYENGDFDDYVFRTDPEQVERFMLRLHGTFGKGFSGGLRARLVDADNPVEISHLDQSTTAIGLSLNWDHAQSESGAGLTADWLDLDSETDLILPDGTAGVSVYGLDLLTLTAHGYTSIKKTKVSASITQMEDSGSTWPLESWNARLNLSYPLNESVDLGAFIEHWSYTEDLASADDYDVTRYGALIRWSFE